MARNNAGGHIAKGQKNFAAVPAPTVPRSVFNRDTQLFTGFKAGDLVPIFRDEVTPGDTINMGARFFGRLEPLIRPIMSGLYVDVFFFAVPHRLVWDNWQKMHGEQTDPGDSTDFLAPLLDDPGPTGFGEDSLHDYMGVPPGVQLTNISAMWARAYTLIWNEWFRDQKLQDTKPVATDDGPDTPSDYPLQKRGKRHDYFTSANPYLQKGNAVNLPIGATTAPLVTTTTTGGVGVPTFDLNGTTSSLQQVTASTTNTQWSSIPGSGNPLAAWQDPGLEADLTTATATTVNELREAIALQQVLETDARGGTRYTEMIRAHFGVSSEDQRLQRPELLGLSSFNVNPHAVTNMGQIGNPLGALGAFGTLSGNCNFTRSFTEHMMIIGLASLRSDLIYQQGVSKDFTRRDRYDWPLPGLAHLGEQEILSQEIYADGTANDQDVFGYQERYAERRYKPSEVTSIMRSTHSQSQDYYHLAQDFGSRPLLNSTFIEENPPMSRVLAQTEEVQILFNAWFTYRHAQPLPVYGVPGLRRL